MNEKQLIEIESGDLIVFRWRDGVAAKHLGVLTDTDHFIHAYEGHSVMEFGAGVSMAQTDCRRVQFS